MSTTDQSFIFLPFEASRKSYWLWNYLMYAYIYIIPCKTIVLTVQLTFLPWLFKDCTISHAMAGSMALELPFQFLQQLWEAFDDVGSWHVLQSLLLTLYLIHLPVCSPMSVEWPVMLSYARPVPRFCHAPSKEALISFPLLWNEMLWNINFM